jgi:hypothetical protein
MTQHDGPRWLEIFFNHNRRYSDYAHNDGDHMIQLMYDWECTRVWYHRTDGVEQPRVFAALTPQDGQRVDSWMALLPVARTEFKFLCYLAPQHYDGLYQLLVQLNGREPYDTKPYNEPRGARLCPC